MVYCVSILICLKIVFFIEIDLIYNVILVSHVQHSDQCFLCIVKVKAKVAQLVKNLPAMQETWFKSLSWEDSPGEGNGYPFQYSGLENSMDYIVHGVTKSQI